MNFAPPRRQEEQVDVTPLIDIIFQLVLFFMVSTTFVNSPGIEVDREVEHGRVVAVMDLARSYGLLKLAIATEPVADD